LILGENVALPPVPLPIDEPITSPRVLVCEGAGDKNFFEQLIKERQLPDFYITYPREEFEGGGGKSKFAVRLRSLRLQHGFDLVKGIIVAGDNDRDQQSSFANVRKLILDSGYKPPNKPLQTVRGDPAVCIMMIPFGEDGQLETLCLRAIKDAWPTIYQCAEDYANCSGISGNWSPGKIERAMLRALTAHICKKDPNTSLSHHWHDGREIVIPLGHQCFTPLADFMAGFDGAIADA
jgi:hypothetical protein